MRFDKIFRKVTPRRNLVFSGYEFPCSNQQKWRVAGSNKECDRFDWCNQLRQREISGNARLATPLRGAYSESLKVTYSEMSSSLIVRSEQQFHRLDIHRLAVRKHLFEMLERGNREVSSSDTDCCSLVDGDELGQYVGFVDLRKHFSVSPLAMGLLVEPGYMREDPNAFVITGDYAPLFGAHSFRSTVYSMQDRSDIAGAKCAQACIIMALGMLSDRRAQLKGSFTLTYLAARATKSATDPHQSGVPLRTFKVDGLNAREMAAVLRECNSSPSIHHLDLGTRHSKRLQVRMIEAYVNARFPVLLIVDPRHWYADERITGDSAHAVTIVGYRRSSTTGEIEDFIVHDPGSEPFMLRSVDHCFSASEAFHHLADFGLAIAVAENSIRVHLSQCIRWFRPIAGTRLDANRESDRNSFNLYCLGDKDRRLQIRLTARGSLARLFNTQDCEAFRHWFDAKVPIHSQFWFVGGYAGDQLQVGWVFPVSANTEAEAVAPSWCTRIALHPTTNEVLLWSGDGSSDPISIGPIS
ncbi:MAG: hypothetical protein H8E66_13380 [Planctomycetes bacterium]|nr:hypothetical protein [Planctomycetota bacterium]